MSETPEKEPSPEPEPKRKWYQYSLRTLLIVMVLFCFLFAWGGYKIRQAERQKEAVAWVEKLGGYVIYDYMMNNYGGYISNVKPPGPDWLREWIGIHYFCNVEEVYFPPSEKGELGTWSYYYRLDETPLQSLPFLKKITLLNVFIRKQQLVKFQAEFPNCEIIRQYSGHWQEQYWCKQCNDWHFQNATHTDSD